MLDETRARQVVEEWSAYRGPVVALARVLSLAVQIEPWLIRRARLTLVPSADVATEAELWFSPLIASRTSEGIELEPQVVELLRPQLQQDQGLLQGAWSCVQIGHADLSELLRREEELTWLGLREPYPLDAIRRLLGEVYRVVHDGPRRGVAAWAARALPSLPRRVRDEEVAQHLLVASRLVLRVDRSTGFRLAPGEDWVGRLPILRGGLVEVGLGMREGELEVEEPPEPGATTVSLPHTQPLALEASWDGGAGRASTLLLPRLGGRVRSAVGRRNLRIRLADQTSLKVERLGPLGHLLEVPSLPRPWVERHELGELKKELLGGGLSRLALTGPPGIGKTALAVRLARDHAVRAQFPDGILFVSLSQDRPPERPLGRLLAAGEASKEPAKGGRAAPNEALRDRACMIVLDDVVSEDKVEPFDVLGDSGALLLVGRVPEAFSRAHSVYSLDGLDVSQCHALLAQMLEQELDVLPAEANEIASLCKGRPEAIRLAASRLRRGEAWSAVLSELQSSLERGPEGWFEIFARRTPPELSSAPVGPGSILGLPDGGASTICCILRDSEGQKYFLAANPGRSEAGGPCVLLESLTAKAKGADVVAHFDRGVFPSVEGEEFLGCLARVAVPDDRLQPRLLLFRGVTSLSQIEPGDRVQLLGAASGRTRGRVFGQVTRATIQTGAGTYRFGELVAVKGEKSLFSQAGDGGGPVVDEQGRLVGMLAAGSSDGRRGGLSYVAPIEALLRAQELYLFGLDPEDDPKGGGPGRNGAPKKSTARKKKLRRPPPKGKRASSRRPVGSTPPKETTRKKPRRKKATRKRAASPKTNVEVPTRGKARRKVRAGETTQQKATRRRARVNAATPKKARRRKKATAGKSTRKKAARQRTNVKRAAVKKRLRKKVRKRRKA